LRAYSDVIRSIFEVIETSSFNICLDDQAPFGLTERWNQFLLSGTTNRWSDKSLQFVICANGASAILAEHSVIDGGTLEQLNGHLQRRLAEDVAATQLTNGHTRRAKHSLTSGHDHTYGIAQPNGLAKSESPPSFKRLQFEDVESFADEVDRVQKNFLQMTVPLAGEIGTYMFPSLSASLLRNRGYAPRAACQVAIQLAARIYFGEQVPSWETVSLRAFRRGRVDIIQTVLASMYAFCSTALQGQEDRSKLRSLFMAATQAHTNNVTRASRGLGFAGHMYALQEVVQEGETLPEIFSDPTYPRTRPAKLMTDCVDWNSGLVAEGGWVMSDPEHVWVHYEVLNDDLKLFVTAPVGCTEAFHRAFERAAAIALDFL
jgi:hypothetical protein